MEPDAPNPVLDEGAARHVLLLAVGIRAFGVLGLAYVAGLVWRRGYINTEQLTERPGDLLFFFIHGVHLVFHEAGHVIFGLFGEFMGVFGGSLNQVLIPATGRTFPDSFLRRRKPVPCSTNHPVSLPR